MKFKVGDVVKFRNIYAYPSLTKQVGKVMSVPDNGYQYYGVKFDKFRMACNESELMSV